MTAKSKSKSLTQRARGSRGKTCLFVVMVCAMACGLGWAQGAEPEQSSGQAAGKSLPDSPGASQEKKEESGNPVQAVADKT